MMRLYINTNTRKFHYSTCSNVDLMKNKNKIVFVGEYDELIKQSYDYHILKSAVICQVDGQICLKAKAKTLKYQ